MHVQCHSIAYQWSHHRHMHNYYYIRLVVLTVYLSTFLPSTQRVDCHIPDKRRLVDHVAKRSRNIRGPHAWLWALGQLWLLDEEQLHRIHYRYNRALQSHHIWTAIGSKWWLHKTFCARSQEPSKGVYFLSMDGTIGSSEGCRVYSGHWLPSSSCRPHDSWRYMYGETEELHGKLVLTSD